MPKRIKEKLEKYQAKIRKLEKEENRENESPNAVLMDDPQTPPLPASPSSGQTSPVIPEESLLNTTEPELDPVLLEALGEAEDDSPTYGPPIHEKLAQRWTPILQKGLPTETKQQLLKEYIVPDNCKLLKAPLLNPEIIAAVADFVKGRDKKLQTKQDQLGLGITAINKAMSILLTSENKVEALKRLSDGCRILTDLHYTETQVRSKLITPGLDKSVLNVIQGHHRDETLFGNALGEKIKASKAIEKQGLQIKKPFPVKPSTSSAPVTPVTRPHHLGNWKGPPRYQHPGRGGRMQYRHQYRRTPLSMPQQQSQLNRQPVVTPVATNRRAPTQH